ncbi:MAG: GGDEF domain-containing protein [Candidatus Aureabacteria bacterium]|nr:GGDEF domain-containing protein [Candidatus Auribacterota bacterium]
MITRQRSWEKLLLLSLSILFAVIVPFSLPRQTISLSFFIIPIILAASYYGLPGGLGCAGVSVIIAGVIARGAGMRLFEPQMIAQVILYFLVGSFGGFMQREQERIQGMLHSTAITDELTGLYNYQHFRTRIHEEVKRAKRYGHPLSLMMCDIDRFKKINDTLGHSNGNFVLNKMASLMKDSIRESDMAFRYGGDEFAIILPETGSEAEGVARRILDTVNDAFATEAMDDSLRPSLTAGIAIRDAEKPFSAELLISFADQALYRAKRAGKPLEVAALGEQSS